MDKNPTFFKTRVPVLTRVLTLITRVFLGSQYRYPFSSIYHVYVLSMQYNDDLRINIGLFSRKKQTPFKVLSIKTLANHWVIQLKNCKELFQTGIIQKFLNWQSYFQVSTLNPIRTGLGRICHFGFQSLPAARRVMVETWQFMTFLLASSSTS